MIRFKILFPSSLDKIFKDKTEREKEEKQKKKRERRKNLREKGREERKIFESFNFQTQGMKLQSKFLSKESNKRSSSRTELFYRTLSSSSSFLVQELDISCSVDKVKSREGEHLRKMSLMPQICLPSSLISFFLSLSFSSSF